LNPLDETLGALAEECTGRQGNIGPAERSVRVHRTEYPYALSKLLVIGTRSGYS